MRNLRPAPLAFIAAIALCASACEVFTYDMFALGRHERSGPDAGDPSDGGRDGGPDGGDPVDDPFDCFGSYEGGSVDGAPSLWADWPMADSTPYCLNGQACPRKGEENHGQDGNRQIHPPAWDLSIEGVARDLVTGYYWQRETGSEECTSVTAGGFNDWRRPTRIELLSILDYGRTDVLLDPSVFPYEPQPVNPGRSNLFASAPDDRGWYYVDVVTGLSYRSAFLGHFVKCVRP